MVIFHESGCFTLFKATRLISVQDYRIATGCFVGEAQFSSLISKKQGESRTIVNLNQEEVLTRQSLGYVSGGSNSNKVVTNLH